MSNANKSQWISNFPSQGIHVLGIDANKEVFYEIRPYDDSWPNFNENISLSEPGKVCSTVHKNDLWVFVITKEGRIARTIRKANGAWQPWVTHTFTNGSKITYLTCCSTYRKSYNPEGLVWLF